MFDAVADVDFFPLLGEGAQILKRLDEDSDSFFADLSRLREILSVIGEGEGQTDELFFSLDDKAKTVQALRQYMDGPMAILPAAVKTFEEINVIDLFAEVGATLAKPIPLEKEYIELMQSYSGKGYKIGFDPQEVISLDAEVERIRSENISATYQEKYKQLVQELNALDTRLTEEVDKLRNGQESIALQLEAELNQKIENFKKAQEDLWENLVSDWQTRQRKAMEKAIPHGQKIITDLVEASPVSAEQANQWVSKQEIDKSAVTRLKKSGYPREQVEADMAEFYRLVGGKCPAIAINTTGRKRASASGIEGRRGEKVINIGSGFNKRVLWHEMGHHLEFDALCKAAANGFLMKRRESSNLYTLRSLTGNNNYSANESAYRDSFMNPYVGKFYHDGVTEVFSMGMEMLSDPIAAARFAAKDPEHFALITGYVSSPLTPAQMAKIRMHHQGLSQDKQKIKTEQSEYTELLERMASKVTLTKDDWYESLADLDKDRLARMVLGYRSSSSGKGMPTYLGSYNGLRVFSGSFESYATRRKSKGYKVYLSVDGSGFVQWDYYRGASIHGDMTTLRAFLFAAYNKYETNGLTDLYSTARYEFMQRNPPSPVFYSNFIKLAKQYLGNEA